MADEDLTAVFDALIGELAWPMAVVTVAAPDEARGGCLVGFHGQCGIEPRRYAAWISRANRTRRVAARSSHAAVHLLGQGDTDVAELFGEETGDEVDKFARCAWTPGPGGVPLLDAVPNRIVGSLLALVDVAADHACAVVAPVRVDHSGLGRPLTLPQVAGLDAGHAPGGGPG